MKKSPRMMQIIKIIEDTIKKFDMIKSGDTILVGVSGGADSVFLLLILLELKEKIDFKIKVCNIDHALRGEESAKETKYVKELCEKLGVKCISKRIDIKKVSDKKKSFEENAREKRYGFFIDTANKENCNVIATGHTLNDQVETVVMRFIMGTTLKSLCGVPPVRKQKDKIIIRPLIKLDRKSIEYFLDEKKVAYVTDSSNKDTSFLRNKIRLEVLPYLEKMNPQIFRTLSNFSEDITEEVEFSQEHKEKTVKDIVSERLKGEISIKISDIILQPSIIRKNIFKELFVLAGGNIKKLTYRHWKDAEELIVKQDKGKSLNFPGKICVTRTRNSIVFSRMINSKDKNPK